MIKIQPDQWPEVSESIRRLVNAGRWGCYAFERGGYYISIPHEGCCNKHVDKPYIMLDDDGKIIERVEHRPAYDVRDYVRFEGLPEDPYVVRLRR